MGGLRSKMPITFWTFVIGGMALSGLPFITAGFWSKDEILLDSFRHAPIVFVVLAIAALFTAFYTTRQIMMTFFGEPRTEAASHASESTWTMTTPLIILAFFAITAGWMNIPSNFPGFGLIAQSLKVDHWFEHFLEGARLPEAAAEAANGGFEVVPLATSLIVALGGILIGWLVYRNAWKKSDDADPMSFLGPIYAFLQKKYMLDELYDWVFVKPSQWFSETVSYLWIDKGIIDGILHTIGAIAYKLGIYFRDGFEKPVINDGADYLAKAAQWLGRSFRVIQTGRIQNYLAVGLLSALLFGLVYVLRYFGLL